jgi:phosphoserine phosphatase RsbU/P
MANDWFLISLKATMCMLAGSALFLDGRRHRDGQRISKMEAGHRTIPPSGENSEVPGHAARTVLSREIEMPDTNESHAHSPHSMTCMEIWGGNRATARAVTLPGLDAWVYSRPYQQSESGGDVYYVSNCATGRITRLMLADVSGHGSAVADIANELRLLMRRYVNHFQQLKFVTSMNEAFANLAHSGGFATAVVATFLAPTRTLTFSNAGHPCPLVYTAKDRRWRLLDVKKDAAGHLQAPSDLPLGIFEDGTYAELDLELDVGDLVLFYTDAFIESHDRSGELLGSESFLNIVSELDVEKPELLLDQIIDKMTSLYPGNLSNDDVTLLLFRPTGQATQAAFTNRVLAPFRFILGMVQSLVSGGRGMPLPEFSKANLLGTKYEPLSRRKQTATNR